MEAIKQAFGVGQARDTARRAAHRPPFGLTAHNIDDLLVGPARPARPRPGRTRDARPWYATKTTISTADAHGALRRAFITAKCRRGHRDQLNPRKSWPTCWPGKTPRDSYSDQQKLGLVGSVLIGKNGNFVTSTSDDRGACQSESRNFLFELLPSEMEQAIIIPTGSSNRIAAVATLLVGRLLISEERGHG
ncbi:hypothetical protein [Nonomuraea polychroma]|uniref:hypothetical protein n=1 Tax=Nonomuraea polychroma TaxID=46176 RepID=UPI000FDD5596|nr:hypothetical protein [Nonomuraea polychroma]